MVLLNKYYQLIERNTEEIHVAWKALTIATFVLSSLTGLYSTFCFSNVKEAFGDNCVLHAEISFVNTTKDINEFVNINHQEQNLTTTFIPIDLTLSTWGKDADCNFCGFTPVLSTMFATVWAAFYIMCPKGGRGSATSVVRQPFRLIYPSLIYAVIYIIIIWISSSQLAQGIRIFCEQFEPIYGTKFCNAKMNEYTLQFHERRHRLYQNMLLAVIFSYATLVLWMCSAVIILLRLLLVVDFKLQQVSIYSEDKEVDAKQEEEGKFEGFQDLELRSRDLTFDSAQSNLSVASMQNPTLRSFDFAQRNLPLSSMQSPIVRSASLQTKPHLPSKFPESVPHSSHTSYFSVNDNPTP